MKAQVDGVGLEINREDCEWWGSNVIFHKGLGVNIGEGAIVVAGSVVAKSLSSYEI